MWASDYMRLRYEVPQLFQENPQNSSLSIELQRLAIRSQDVVYYFTDLTTEEDVMRVTFEPGCKYYCYEQEKLLWFQNQISDITIQYKEIKPFIWNLSKKKELDYWKSSQAFRKRQHQYKRKW